MQPLTPPIAHIEPRPGPAEFWPLLLAEAPCPSHRDVHRGPGVKAEGRGRATGVWSWPDMGLVGWFPGGGPQEEMLQRTLREGVGGWTLRREAILDEGKGWGGLWPTLSISAISRQDGGPVLIAWWPAEVLNNGLAEHYSHCRDGLHLRGQGQVLRDASFPQGSPALCSCVPPLLPAPSHTLGLRKLALGPPGHSPGQAKVMVTGA